MPSTIGVDLAHACAESGGQRNGTGIGTAPPQRGDVARFVNTLKTGNNANMSGIKFFTNTVGTDTLDACPAVCVVGDHLNLLAGKADGLLPHGIQSHCPSAKRSAVRRC